MHWHNTVTFFFMINEVIDIIFWWIIRPKARPQRRSRVLCANIRILSGITLPKVQFALSNRGHCASVRARPCQCPAGPRPGPVAMRLETKGTGLSPVRTGLRRLRYGAKARSASHTARRKKARRSRFRDRRAETCKSEKRALSAPCIPPWRTSRPCSWP